MSEMKIQELVALLNMYRDEYYNKNEPSISDAIYDRLFDELAALEESTGIFLPNSPTQTVGYDAVSNIEKITHPIPVLSLDKTKKVSDLVNFVGNREILLMHKLDGLTLKLEYENGKLMRASTRGNGYEGENVTHNVRNIVGVPVDIPYKNRLVITGEGYIQNYDFNKMKETVLDSAGKPYINARNFAASSIRCIDAAVCEKRRIRFAPFNVLEGLNEDPSMSNSKDLKLISLKSMNFSPCEFILMHKNPSENKIQECIIALKSSAEKNGVPIDGIVVTFNNIAYSLSCGRTGHHYKDAIAYKFADDLDEVNFE